MKRRTKIVCTLGPATSTRAKVKELIEAGMNVARLNCSHGDWEAKADWIEWIRELSSPVCPVAILADLQGPKFRLGVIEGGQTVLASGQSITVAHEGATLPVPPGYVWDAMAPGSRVLLGDGIVEIKLGPFSNGKFDAKVVSGGLVKSKQGVTLVGKSFETPCLTPKDLSDLDMALSHEVDFIALSYVREAADMIHLRDIVRKRDPFVGLVAKVETKEALRSIEEVIKVSDAVMVARGDLGLQMEIEDVPAAQKRIIFACNAAGKPVITATQMLESMMTSPRPTRAEASDVANAILDGTDAVMLSGETASGEYPVHAVRTMAKIAERTDPFVVCTARSPKGLVKQKDAHTEAVSQAAVSIATALGAKAIVTTSTSGATPRVVSKHKPSMPVLTVCWNPRVLPQLSMVWGVQAVNAEMQVDTDQAMSLAVQLFLRHRQLKLGDTVVITAGYPVGAAGNTNLILVRTV